MSKRSKIFERDPRDFYATPYKAINFLIDHLPPIANRKMYEPCVGDGRLTYYIDGSWVGCSDIEKDASTYNYGLPSGTMFITNPPWSNPQLNRIVANLSEQGPTWLLMYADWAYNTSSSFCKDRLKKIVAVGRLSWCNNNVTGMDNCAWYYFDKDATGPTEFIMR